jgi:hypothetical protein
MSLIPDLLPHLDERDCQVPAARALLTIAPGNLGGVPVERLAAHLAEAAGDPWMSAGDHRQAVGLLSEILRGHPDALPAETRTRLRDLAERPQRLSRNGIVAVGHTIREDEELRSAIRGLLTAGNP